MFYNQTTEELLVEFNTNKNGLSMTEASERLAKDGKNQLQAKVAMSWQQRLLNQFKDFMIYILLAAAGISFVTGEITDGIIIILVVVLNAVLGYIQENNAEKSLEALKNMQVAEAQVLRDGNVHKIAAAKLVVGDIVLLNAGDVVPADGRLIETAALKIEESQLTGESLAVEKHNDIILSENLALGDRHNMAYSSSKVATGRAKMLVTAIGMQTEIGKIAGILSAEPEEKTPLQIKLAKLGKTLGIAAMLICAVIFVVGYLQGRGLIDMLMLSISLAVAAIPEGLPAIVTIVLSMGVGKMIKANAIVRKLPAVETLGSASVICSDKTGTLTQNKMTVTDIYTTELVDASKLKQLNQQQELLTKTAVYCNDGALTEEEGKVKEIGDPTETALLVFAKRYAINKANLKGERVAEVPFDSERKLMTTIIDENGLCTYVKGAPDQLLARCTHYYENGKIKVLNLEKKEQILLIIADKSREAKRLLAYAYKELDKLPTKVNSESIENDLIFVGLTAMIDPPRLEVKAAVDAAHKAGVKTVMITGDYKDTAVAIAKELGILGEGIALTGSELDELSEEEFAKIVGGVRVYARVSPEHKVKIVRTIKASGEIVAMTGDGVNDAPALKAANIGCAMGITGTDVSKEASDLILTDDNFTTIVAAIKEGRTIFDNIKKSITFLLSSNLGEILTLFTAIIAFLPTPLLAIHILWINLVTDSFPALALGTERSEIGIMERAPRPLNENIINKKSLGNILLGAFMISSASLIAFMIGLKVDVMTAQTMTFLTLSLSQLVHSYNLRSEYSLFKIGAFSNKKLNQGAGLSFVLMVLVYSLPFTRFIFKLCLLSMMHLGAVLSLSIIPLLGMEIYKFLRNGKKITKRA